MDGILNVRKPRGWTSFDVVASVRRGTRVKRVGHAGTLDPMAEGVLPVCLGQATRLVEYLVDAHKVYVATVRLGVETNTYDAEGEVVTTAPADGVRAADVESALALFRGEIDQRPPLFSAIKHEGVPLYRLARKGEEVEVAPRRVTVFRLDLLRFEPPLVTLEVECSKGTYIRSLAHDLGARLGVGGSLDALTRTRVGGFRLEDAVEVETLRSEMASGAWQERLLAPDEIVLDWPAAVFAPENAERIRHGQVPSLSPVPGVDLGRIARCRAYSTGGDFLAVLRQEAGSWRAEKVFTAAG